MKPEAEIKSEETMFVSEGPMRIPNKKYAVIEGNLILFIKRALIRPRSKMRPRLKIGFIFI